MARINKNKIAILGMTFIFILCAMLIEKMPSQTSDGTDIETERVIVEEANPIDLELSTIPSDLEPASLVRVVDGDTIVVSIDGTEQKVRLIGIDTPESVHPDGSKNTEQGNLASENTKVLLEDVDTVWLERDTSDTDRYGRLLRYVWLTPDRSDLMNMLNARLVADGWATPKAYAPDTAHAADFEAIEKGIFE